MWFKKRIFADAAAGLDNPNALHKEGVAAKKALEAARKTIADAIGAHADEIVFTASGTEANNLGVQGVIRAQWQGRRLHAITSAIEHSSVLEPLRAAARDQIDLTELPVDGEGILFPTAVPMAITPQTCLVSVQLVNSEVGTIEPIREIGKEIKRAKHRKIYFHTDASQAPLWLDINVEKLGVDLMTLDAQKVLGPKGVGALYVRRGTPLEPLIYGGGQERGLRAGTENVAGAVAFAAALKAAQAGVGKRVKKTTAVRDYLWQEIQKVLPDAVLNGPHVKASPCHRVANNLNISIPGLDAQMAVIALDALGVAASTRSACDIGGTEPSHVIKALGTAPELAGTAIRLTLLPDATYSQMRRIAAALLEAASRYRRT